MEKLFKRVETGLNKSLPYDYWFRIAEKLAKESGRVPDPLEIRAAAFISALGLPSGETSALEVNEEGERTNPEKDRIIAEYNKPGVFIDEENKIVSTDFRDIYPEGLPQELKGVLDPDTRAIMEIEYEHAKYIREKFGNTEDEHKADVPIHYFRLPGGIDLFVRGYVHDSTWHENRKSFFKKMNKYAKVICIEGFTDKPFGESLNLRWSNLKGQRGNYDALMHEAVDGGFDGLFAEIDARDKSKIRMDSIDSDSFFSFLVFPELPDAFFDNYFTFLKREHPSLAEKFGSPENLKQALIKQSTTFQGLLAKGRYKEIYQKGKMYSCYPYLGERGEVSFEPTFLELGQKLFTDALAALKLHLMAKLMADGHLPKGPIIDYEGLGHLSSKSFFLRYPWYAAQVVLRTINELMAGKVKEKGNISEIYRVFENPDWGEVVKEIVRLPLKQVENDPSKPTALGPNQRKLLDYPVDVLQIYGLDPKNIMPGDEEIQKIRESIKNNI
jgi:hypothetical protein